MTETGNIVENDSVFDRDYHDVKGYVPPAVIQQLVSIMGLPSISVSQRVEYRDIAHVELPRFRGHNESDAEGGGNDAEYTSTVRA